MGAIVKRYRAPSYDIGQIIRQQSNRIKGSAKFTAHQKRMLGALADCRTAALGRHKIACTDCGNIQIAYNSCRNRNCPKCQNRHRDLWLRARTKEVLPVPYFHLVFTLPSELNGLCLHHPGIMYGLLFKSAWYTVHKLGRDKKWLGAQLGMTTILHTWGSNLSLHPHVHCIVPAGGLDDNGKWKQSKSKGSYLFNRGVMGLVFRARYVKLLRKAIKDGKLPKADDSLFKSLFSKEWITYAKRPFKDPEQILNYIGRYSHKIAITNHRIKKVTKEEVVFTYKNYRKGGQQELLRLTQEEFIRRFAMHIIPYKFVRIRHYGILSIRNKKVALAAARKALEVVVSCTAPAENQKGVPENHYPCFCPCCESTTIHLLIEVLPAIRGSPLNDIH